MKKVSYKEGHRERLRKKFIQGKLTEYELCELLMMYAIPRRDVKEDARELFVKYGGIHHIITAPMDSLMQNRGVKESAAVLIKLIHEIMVLGYKSQLKDSPIFHDEKRLADYCYTKLAGKVVEEFHVLYLDNDLKLIDDYLHSVGTIDWAAVYPREILKRALALNARSVVLLHNHPASHTSFSQPDINITEDIKRILKSFDIELYDHILVSGTIVHSAKNMFLIK